MSHDLERRHRAAAAANESARVSPLAPGKRTLVEAELGAVQRKAHAPGAETSAHAPEASGGDPWAGLDDIQYPPGSTAEMFRDVVEGMRAADVQRRGGGNQNAEDVQRAAAQGITGSSGSLPFLEQIQRSFGAHDVSHVKAHTDAAAAAGAKAMGAEAYATGEHVAFAGTPSLHTAAHEAAHSVQQRAGVQLKGGVGAVGDAYEQHADAVADRVVQGQSAEDLLDAFAPRPRASGSVQPMGSSAPVQMNLLGDAAALVGDVAGAVERFVDLLGPKTALMSKITDPSWIADEVGRAQANDAHPRHKAGLDLRLVGIGVMAGLEAMGFARRIAGCNDLPAVEALDVEFTVWKGIRMVTLLTELALAIEDYRAIERGWLTNFGAHAPITKDPAHPNHGGQPVAITFTPGVPASTVTVETRVNCTFGLTAQAQADHDGDGNPDVAAWTPEEQTHFMAQFQRQLNDIWTTGAGAVAPFRASAPSDHLLATEAPKWSDLTGTMQARVTADAATPHFNLDVFKEAPGEHNRAFVGGGGTGTFYLKNADAGYHRLGAETGQRNDDEQPTLAHEWHHMIGNPDEYAEDSASQSADPSTPASRSGDDAACVAHFNSRINGPASTPAQVAHAQADLAALRAHATDVDPTTPGFEAGIFPLAGRPDIPDSCFAIRGTWADGPDHVRLRPGARSARGGTHISSSAADAARLSDRGSDVRPYMREGIVQELATMLSGEFTPEVSFDHNFRDLPPATVPETMQARIQNVLHDVAVGATTAPSPQPEDRVPTGPYHHGEGGADDHAHE